MRRKWSPTQPIEMQVGAAIAEALVAVGHLIAAVSGRS